MFKAINLFFVTAVMFVIWVAPGSAFQFFGSNSSTQTGGTTSLQYNIENEAKIPGNNSLDLGNGQSSDSSDNQGMNIWIPGLGVVGKMPKLDFGLEMLYGAQDTPSNVPGTAHELEEFESDFAIKGTIKRKF